MWGDVGPSGTFGWQYPNPGFFANTGSFADVYNLCIVNLVHLIGDTAGG